MACAARVHAIVSLNLVRVAEPNCGRLTARPIAVRLAAALKPVSPSCVISSEGNGLRTKDPRPTYLSRAAARRAGIH